MSSNSGQKFIGRNRAPRVHITYEDPYNAERLIRHFSEHRQKFGFELRATILGHVQRGGTPGAFDRLLATRLGAAAVDSLARGEHGVLIGLNKGEITAIPLADVVANRKPLDLSLLELAKVLAR